MPKPGGGNRLLGEARSVPAYNQVSIEDSGTHDLPQWESGSEQAVATPHAIYVATRSDLDGDVLISVFEGGDPTGLGALVFDGTLVLTSSALDVGNSIAATVARIDVGGPGARGLRVFVDPPELADTVSVLIAPAGDHRFAVELPPASPARR